MTTIPFITITESAGRKIAGILSQRPDKPHFRIKIKGGGCSGFEYVFGIDDEIGKRDFHATHQQSDLSFVVLVDSISYQYIKNATIDYRQDANGERFAIENPNSQTSCSCGSSFSPKQREE